jgi:hypothetical protein
LSHPKNVFIFHYMILQYKLVIDKEEEEEEDMEELEYEI